MKFVLYQIGLETLLLKHQFNLLLGQLFELNCSNSQIGGHDVFKDKGIVFALHQGGGNDNQTDLLKVIHALLSTQLFNPSLHFWTPFLKDASFVLLILKIVVRTVESILKQSLPVESAESCLLAILGIQRAENLLKLADRLKTSKLYGDQRRPEHVLFVLFKLEALMVFSPPK